MGQTHRLRPFHGSEEADQFWRGKEYCLRASLQYTERIKQLGISEADADALGIGEKRGKLWIALRHDNGSIAGFAEVTPKLPQKLLPKQGTS
jgi:hypothetical protein